MAAVEIKRNSAIPSHLQCRSLKQLAIFVDQLEWENFHQCKERILLLQVMLSSFNYLHSLKVLPAGMKMLQERSTKRKAGKFP